MTRLTSIDGMPVIDAKGPLKLKVTRGDISKAAHSIQKPEGCAVARACYRDLGVIEARVHLSRVYLRTNGHNWVRYKTPGAMRDEIIAFDRGGVFEPGDFTLYPVEKNAQLGTPRRGGKATGRGKKRRPPRIVTNVRSGPVAHG